MTITEQQAAALALQVQDACNLCGVVMEWANILQQDWMGELGTNGRNTHPVSRLFAYKCMALAGREPIGESDWYTQAMVLCARLGRKVE